VTHEWRPHRDRRQQPAAYFDLHRVSGRARHTRQADRARQRRRVGAAGDLAVADATDDNALVAAQHRTLIQHQADPLVLAAARAYRLERPPADEFTLRRGERHAPGQARFERAGVLVHVAAIQVHPGLQSQRIACAQAAGAYAAGVEALP